MMQEYNIRFFVIDKLSHDDAHDFRKRERDAFFFFLIEKEISRHLCTREVCNCPLAGVSNFGHYATYDIRSLSRRSCDRIARIGGKKRLALSRDWHIDLSPANGDGLPAFSQSRKVTSHDRIVELP